jgi:hypothetical protein
MRRSAQLVGWVAALALVSGAAGQELEHAIWQVIYLEPPGVDSSTADAAFGAWQGGTVGTNGAHPAIWHASAGSFVDLLPGGWKSGHVYGMDGPWQVGVMSDGYSGHPVIWSGTPQGIVDLTPGGRYPWGCAWAAANGQQVGFVWSSHDAQNHAALWRGSAASFVDLNPAGARQSDAACADGTTQGGGVNYPQQDWRACIWHGSAASFVDLHPSGASRSGIAGLAGGAQVGSAHIGMYDHAAVWHGSAATFIDLHPPGAVDSYLNATTGAFHVGKARFSLSEHEHAALWVGNHPGRTVDLNRYLVSPYTYGSEARAVSVQGNCLYVAGVASTGDALHAVVWTAPLSVPPRRHPQQAGEAEEVILP